MTTQDHLIELISRHDPLHTEAGELTTKEHLRSARTVLDVRTAGPRVVVPRPRWHRRVVVVAAVATAVPVAAVLLAPALTSLPGFGNPVIGTATASESGLSCGVGYAQPIRPDSADPRPWPSTLPAGWIVRNVFARASDVMGWCTTPSLTAAQVDGTGLVTGSIKITGPTPAIEVDPSEQVTPDRIGIYDAQRLGRTGAPEPIDAAPSEHFAWIITDGNGEQWYAAVDGYPVDTARRLLSAATYDGRRVNWDAPVAPDLRVLHQRTGDPYPTKSTGQDWYLRFAVAGGERMFQASSGRTGEGALTETTVDSRLITVGGRPARILQVDGLPVAVYAELRPEVVVFTEVLGDLDEVLRLLESVEDLPSDDPRLDDLALKESYQDDRD